MRSQSHYNTHIEQMANNEQQEKKIRKVIVLMCTHLNANGYYGISHVCIAYTVVAGKKHLVQKKCCCFFFVTIM